MPVRILQLRFSATDPTGLRGADELHSPCCQSAESSLMELTDCGKRQGVF